MRESHLLAKSHTSSCNDQTYKIGKGHDYVHNTNETAHFTFLPHIRMYVGIFSLSESSHPQQPHARFYCAMVSSLSSRCV